MIIIIETCSFTSIITSTMYLHMPYLVCDSTDESLSCCSTRRSLRLTSCLGSSDRPREPLLRSAQTFYVDETDPMSREAKSVKACKESGHCASGGFSALRQKTRHLPTPRFSFFLYADCFHSSAPGRSRPSPLPSFPPTH